MKAEPQPARYMFLLVVVLIAAGVGFGAPRDLLQFLLLRLTTTLVASVHAIVVLGACVGGGLLVLPASHSKHMTLPDLLLLSLGCGAGLLSCGVLTLGLLGWGFPAAHWALVGLFLSAGLVRVAVARKRFELPTAPPSQPGMFLPRLLLFCTVALVAVAAYAPPLLFDVTEYHLGAWADYQRTLPPGRFIPMKHNFYARFPFPIESLYFLGLSLGQPMDFAPKLINAAFVLGCAGVVMQLLRRCGLSANWRAAAGFLVLAHPVMRSVSLDAYIDAPSAFFVLAAVLALSVPGASMVVPAALLFGTALATKYTVAQIFLLPFVACFAMPALRNAWRNGHRGIIFRALALGAIPLLFWLGKNVYLYGNPLEPFFTWIFRRGDSVAIAREKFYIESHFPQPLWSAGYWITLAPRLREFGWPLLPAVVLIAVAARGRARETWSALPWPMRPLRLLAFIGISYLLWNLVRESQNRFLLPSIALLICVGIQAIATMPLAFYRNLTAALLLAWGSIHLAHQAITLNNAGEFGYVTRFDLTEPPPTKPGSLQEPTLRENFYAENVGALGEMLPKLKALPPDAEVLLVYEARPYLVPRASVYNTVWDDSELVRLAAGARTAGEVGERLKQAGITHVLVNCEELRRYIQQYTRESKLRELGVRPGEDPATAFYATPTPEDLFPPFFRDARWPDARAAIIEYLAAARLRATAVTGQAPLEIYLAPVQ